MASMLDVAGCVAAADARMWNSWLRCVEDLPGNPYGIEVRRCGSATLLHSLLIPSTEFNRIMYLEPSQAGDFAGLLGYFRERSSPVRVDMTPYEGSVDLLLELERRGFRPTEFESNLYQEIRPDRPQEIPGVAVREAQRSDLDLLLGFYDRSYRQAGRIPEGVIGFTLASIGTRLVNPFWKFYVAECDGVLAGAAAMHVAAGVVSLSDDVVVPSMRGRDVETALVARRIQDARSKGCDLVVSRARVGTELENTLMDSGLRLAYTKVIWTDRWPEPPGTSYWPERNASETEGPAGFSVSSSSAG